MTHKIIKLITIITALCMITSCSPIYDIQHEYIPPRTNAGAVCANNCIHTKNTCKGACSADYNNCETIRRLEQQTQYLAYVNLQQAQKLPIDKTINSFSGYRSCSMASCEQECNNDYTTCYKNCGGQIIEHRVCVAFCK